ncbi:DUF1194 domain-containing protein [Rhizobiales bacterium]|uniref:DUF1194 domain-containing protein n=1 Tax=Hongsoonwoonella zoysiae TaxID=2821844 RepID=UPI00155FFDC3|nr:DUF1194 domain-containing protein [Hongsoonwoonella zoysiae]NRG16164.1 DUF1194 domain-containing protein [Hongsoonwoonella zoysiae]
MRNMTSPPVRTSMAGIRNYLFAACIAIAFWATAKEAAKAEEVDLLLVLAVDISYSMDDDEQRLQRRGYIEAITSDPVVNAIRNGLIGKIAVAYTEWAGSTSQHILVDWHVIASRDDAERFAAALAEAPISRAYRTSIGEALFHAASMFEEAPHTALRRVIDISGDGPNNQGRLAPVARDFTVEKGITINGLPLMLKRPIYGWFDIDNLDVYYEKCVIGGPAAFTIPVRDVEAFPEAIRRKLILEIAQTRQPPGEEGWIDEALSAEEEAVTIQVQENLDPLCTIGETLWRRRMLDDTR